MLAKTLSCGLSGVYGYPVEVEAFISGGMIGFEIVGLPSAAVKESRDRVRAAISVSGLSFPFGKVTVNLAPADVKKEGTAFELAIAVALSHSPKLLVLDEPVSGVDQKGLQLFLDTVLRLKEKHHMAILLVSHDLRLVRKYADHVVLLDKTVLAQGSPADVFATPEFSAVFGTGEEAES